MYKGVLVFIPFDVNCYSLVFIWPQGAILRVCGWVAWPEIDICRLIGACLVPLRIGWDCLDLRQMAWGDRDIP